MSKIIRRNLVFLSLFFLVPLCLPSSSMSQDVQVWTKLGPYGGQTYDIAIDPSNPDKMFAGTYMGDGLFVTTDGASSWQAVVSTEEMPGEDTFKNHAVWAVKIAPSDNNVIWVAHNYWVEKSTDGGQTWTHVWNGTMQSPSDDTCSNCPWSDQFRFCNSLAIDPSDPQTVYVGTSGRYTNWEPCGAIYKTDDGGETWTKMNGPVDSCWPGYGNFDYEVVDLAIDASDPDVIIIWAVTSNNGVFIEEAGPGDTIADGTLYRGEINRFTGEDTWTEIFSMEGGEFYDVEVKPNDSNSIFTANDWGIFRHYFEGNEWKYQWILNLSQEPPLPGEVFARNVRALAFGPKDPDTLYAAWKNSHSKWEGIDTSSKVARGTPPYEDGDWEIFTVDYQFLTLAVRPSDDPSPSEVIFGGELARGVYKSQDHGQVWTPVNNGINALIIYDVDVDPNDATHLLTGTIVGVYEKRGGGDWTLTSNFKYTGAFSVAFDLTDPDGSTYYTGTQDNLAKTTNSGADWTFSNDLPDSKVIDIALGADGSTVFIATGSFGRAGGGVYKSENGGATLTQVISSDESDFNVVAIDPADPDHIFAGGGNYWAPRALGNLYESKNGGDVGTWELTGLTNVVVNALLIDPRDSNIMYAGCGYSGGTMNPVYKSTDGGKTWAPSHEGMPVMGVAGIGVWGSSQMDVFVVASIGNILHYDGSTWVSMRSGTVNRLYNAWGPSGTDVFAVGAAGTVLHYDGQTWTAMDSGTTEDLRGVWGSSDTNVFVVGNSGTLLHYDGSDWDPVDIADITTANLRSIWGTSAANIFAVGYSGTILHYDGSNWAPMDSGTTEMVLGVWGSSGTDVFGVGDKGTILHYDGSAWAPMDSGITGMLQTVWGASGADVFAVGASGTILHYDGSAWAAMDSGATEYIWSVWGASGTDVFAVGDGDTLLHYDGSSWAPMKPEGKSWNSVTDLEFHPQNKDIVYASADQQGVYVSSNQAGNWLNLGTPEYAVLAISTSSLYAATKAGLLQCTGTGVIAGQVTNAISHVGIHMANVSNDFGVGTISISGLYMMVSPSGICDVTATADRYLDKTVPDVTVYGGDVAWANIPMPPDSSVVETTPYHNAGIDDDTPVANDTPFAVHIEDPDGIDITNPASIQFTINDGTTEYTRDLSHPSVTYKKMVSTEDDTQVTKIRVLYDRSKDDEVGDYGFGSTVNVIVDVKDVTQETCSFRIASEEEHNNVQGQIPAVTSVGPELGVFDEEAGQDAGIQVTSGPLKGAMLIYNSDELVEPSFGPTDVLPTLSGGVGVPMNLEPTNWSFDVPVKIYIPCPGYIDVSDLCVYFHNGTSWVYACDAGGNVQPAGENWMVAGSRKNHNGGEPSTIEIQVYHFSGVQASASAPPSAPSTGLSAGPGGGGGGCFISTAACGCHVVNSVETAHRFIGLFILMGCLWLSRSSN